LKKASIQDIATTPGIGEKIAAIIWTHLNPAEEAPEGVDMQTGEILER
jgi:excinuclease ABC subunit C